MPRVARRTKTDEAEVLERATRAKVGLMRLPLLLRDTHRLALFPPAVRTDKKQGDHDSEEEAELDSAGMVHGRTPA